MGTGKKIGEECKRQGMTLRQLSIKAGVPYSTLYSAVKRDSNGMDAETLAKIADALAIDFNWLLHGYTLDEHNEVFIRRLQHEEPVSERELYLQKHPDDAPALKQKKNYDLQRLIEGLDAEGLKMLEEYAEFLVNKRAGKPVDSEIDNDSTPHPAG